MTILDVKCDPITGHFDLHLRLTQTEALDLASRIVACAETIPKPGERPPPAPAPINPFEDKDKS